MKIHFMLLLMGCLLFCQCKNTILKTTVTDVDNLTRSVQTTGDSLGVGNVEYPFPMQETWMVEKSKVDDNFVYTTQRNFQHVETLNAFCQDDSLAIQSMINVDKKHRWFFTYYRYTETFPVISDFEYLPMQDFLSTDEYQIYLADVDSSAYEDKVEEWLAASFFYVLWQDFQQAAFKADPILTPEYLQTIETELSQKFVKDDLADSFLQDDVITEFIAVMDSLLTPQHSFLMIRSDFEKSEKMVNEWFDAVGETMGENFELYVKMPGEIIDTNANEIDSSKTQVSWEFDVDHFLMCDYEMWVDSRKFNTVPTVATGVFFLLGLIFLFKPKRKE